MSKNDKLLRLLEAGGRIYLLQHGAMSRRNEYTLYGYFVELIAASGDFTKDCFLNSLYPDLIARLLNRNMLSSKMKNISITDKIVR